MIKHIVMWKLKSEACGNNREDNALKMKKLLEDLQGKIDEIISIKVSINHKLAPKTNFHVILEVEVDNFEALKIYSNHQLHLKVVEFIKEVSEERVALDYQVC
ncbi:Dabb family protein [Clostridium sp. KNHs214]|uniref:Dabb family protein n=1 Tax=Clostridium sp. KNHs214 TaxID=1540257 RepID=UPI0005541E0D|nr:Dabb family protein [Clostridium sp. KNHs214]